MPFVVRLLLLATLFSGVVGSTGCAHVVRIETTPPGARVSVDGAVIGTSPVELKRPVFVGDQLRVSVEADGYEPQSVTVPASEWYPWPALMACTPMLGLPISLPFATVLLPCFGLGLVVGPAIAIGWAVVTSPTLLSLGLVRKFPDRVVIPLRRREKDGGVLPGDLFYVPDEATPNPLPLPDEPTSPTSPTTPPTSTPDTPPSPGGNPLP